MQSMYSHSGMSFFLSFFLGNVNCTNTMNTVGRYWSEIRIPSQSEIFYVWFNPSSSSHSILATIPHSHSLYRIDFGFVWFVFIRFIFWVRIRNLCMYLCNGSRLDLNRLRSGGFLNIIQLVRFFYKGIQKKDIFYFFLGLNWLMQIISFLQINDGTNDLG